MGKVQVVITRPMSVLGDNKTIVRFEPSTKSEPFVEVSYQVYCRLKRAGAAKVYQEWLSQNVNEKPKPNEQEVSVEVTQVVEQITQTSIESDKQSQKEPNEQEVSVNVDTQDVEQTSIESDEQSPKAKTSKSTTRATKKA
ncbi:hypothetical protein [Bartonella schoenbuchensis]|uniref:Uncharacterized protein n=1 Tax=Bartonella schoenbuchensis (strain DSM 13525 / NCTC 13165 / R1) TaxID=687861 RepID=E6Z0X9_BARSR|nr:hypothetical protein [Bartonella schoenbuchensis]AQX31161.1 hypothetical protein BscR1v2_012470 [Bartonella schoenbuchensis R1]CBI82767.1 conserved hypothetical protein [Bartonella schoenbuchensis R1]